MVISFFLFFMVSSVFSRFPLFFFFFFFMTSSVFSWLPLSRSRKIHVTLHIKIQPPFLSPFLSFHFLHISFPAWFRFSFSAVFAADGGGKEINKNLPPPPSFHFSFFSFAPLFTLKFFFFLLVSLFFTVSFSCTHSRQTKNEKLRTINQSFRLLLPLLLWCVCVS